MPEQGGAGHKYAQQRPPDPPPNDREEALSIHTPRPQPGLLAKPPAEEHNAPLLTLRLSSLKLRSVPDPDLSALSEIPRSTARLARGRPVGPDLSEIAERSIERSFDGGHRHQAVILRHHIFPAFQ